MLALLVSGCGSAPNDAEPDARADESTSDVRSSPDVDVEPRDFDESDGGAATVPEQRWREFDASFDTMGFATSEVGGASFEVMTMAATTQGYVAAGTFEGRLAVWRSDDLQVFDAVYDDACCDRWVRPEAIVEVAGTLLIAGSGEERTGETRVERNFLLSSDDGGTTWRTSEHPAFELGNAVGGVTVLGDAVIVQQNDQRQSGQPTSHTVRSTDLENWDRLVLPGSVEADWPYIVSDGDSTFAVATRYDDGEGAAVGSAIWSSTDDGATFVQRAMLENTTGAFAAVGGRLVSFPSIVASDARHVEPRGVAVLSPGAEWDEQPLDVGQWGDGSLFVGRGDHTASGRIYSVAARTMRASPHYCFDDATTCHEQQGVIVTSEDGLTWRDLAGLDLTSEVADRLSIGPHGEIIVWGVTAQGTRLAGHRGSAADAPDVVDPPEYPAPDIPIDLYEYDDPFPVGSTARIVLGVGGCSGAIRVGGVRWATDEGMLETVPSEWPSREVEWEDGPQWLVYGRIERPSDDVLDFVVEELGTVATFRPVPEADPEIFCS